MESAQKMKHGEGDDKSHCEGDDGPPRCRHSPPSSSVILCESGESRNTGSQEEAENKDIFATD